MKFPVAIVDESDVVVRTFDFPTPFTGPDGKGHPLTVWDFWRPDDWMEKCSGWTVLPVIDAPVTDAGKRIERLPQEQWDVGAEAVTVRYRVTDKSTDELAADLAAVQDEAAKRVNREAGEARARFITVTIGQEGTYLEKAREAQAFLTDPNPYPASYPYLTAEAEHIGQSIATRAALVAATTAAWTLINARIEGLRQGALQMIRDAEAPSAVTALFPIDWPMPG
ncbi:hypothetical protein ACIU1J_02195 [Azospirillum doebereinerae]|uniref:hypothetical protein n=1 Tax=Azospirillum doebereinerae TaxID=92933 RepID=UPI001EE54459|nr:hypothetical protein [Azospirillum doebereinerae]MCG5240438.1 hypothetical protein [Azospirillum doebereinerae]